MKDSEQRHSDVQVDAALDRVAEEYAAETSCTARLRLALALEEEALLDELERSPDDRLHTLSRLAEVLVKRDLATRFQALLKGFHQEPDPLEDTGFVYYALKEDVKSRHLPRDAKRRYLAFLGHFRLASLDDLEAEAA